MNRSLIGIFLFFLSVCSICLISCSGPSVFNGSRDAGGGGKPPGGGPPVVPPQGCNGGSITNPGILNITMTATPPANVDVLAFRLAITGVSLNPPVGGSCSGTPQVETREIKRLETDTNFVTLIPAPAGSYSSISVAFANPVITFLNRTGSKLSGCESNHVCEVTFASAGNITVSSGPFPLSLVTGKNPALRLDINLTNAITSSGSALNVDFTQPNVLTAKLMPISGIAPGVQEQIDDVVGFVRGIGGAGPSTFDVFSNNRGGGTITVDSNTAFDSFPQSCPNNISCLRQDQLVSVDLLIKDDLSPFLGKEIDLLDQQVTDQIEGTIFSIDSSSQFKMVATDIATPFVADQVFQVNPGNIITVQLSNTSLNPTFVVDTKGFPIPVAARTAFEGAADTSELVPGQTVQVHVKGFTPAVSGADAIAVTDRVRLRFTRFTARVSRTAGSFFDITALPGLFPFISGAQPQVQTFPLQTTFENVSGVSGLNPTDVVSVRALFFKSSAPNFFALKVRKR